MRRLVLLLAAAAALPLALSACQKPTDPPTTPVVDRDTTQSLAVRALWFDRDTKTLRGEVHNYKSYPYDSVLVVLEVVDGQLNTLGTLRDSVAQVGPDSTWKFERVFPDMAAPDSATHIKLLRYAGTPQGQARTDVTLGSLVPIPALAR